MCGVEAFVVIRCCSCVCKSIVNEFVDRFVADLFVGLFDHGFVDR